MLHACALCCREVPDAPCQKPCAYAPGGGRCRRWAWRRSCRCWRSSSGWWSCRTARACCWTWASSTTRRPTSRLRSSRRPWRRGACARPTPGSAWACGRTCCCGATPSTTSSSTRSRATRTRRRTCTSSATATRPGRSTAWRAWRATRAAPRPARPPSPCCTASTPWRCRRRSSRPASRPRHS